MKLLVTGSSGFMGSNGVVYIFKLGPQGDTLLEAAGY